LILRLSFIHFLTITLTDKEIDMKVLYWFGGLTAVCLLSPAFADLLTADNGSTRLENNPTPQSTIQGQDAGGQGQTTIIDENGNLKVVNKSAAPQAAPSNNPNNSNTTTGMKQSAPSPSAVLKPPASPAPLPSTPEAIVPPAGKPKPQEEQAPNNALPPGAIPAEVTIAPNLLPPTH
jgi:hypothetical protein